MVDHRRGLHDDWRWLNHHWLVNDHGPLNHHWLLHYDRVRIKRALDGLVNDGLLHNLHRDRLNHDRLHGLVNDDGLGLHINRRGGVDRLGFERFREEESRTDSSEDFSGRDPLFITRIQSGR